MSVPPYPIGGQKLFCAVISYVCITLSLWRFHTALAATKALSLWGKKGFAAPEDDRFLYSLGFRPHRIPQISG